MLIESKGVKLVTDPWLFGSCYWRSWWNFPEVDSSVLDNLKPDYLYITHLHWDHFHGPSIRKLKEANKNLKVIIPQLHTFRMVEDLIDCNIPSEDIIEIKHGHNMNITDDLKIYSYQFGFDNDSALVVSDGKFNLLDMNDCKMFGFPLEQIKKDFDNFDFVFRSHSNAQYTPYCLKDKEIFFDDLRTDYDYVSDFTNFCLSVNSKWAIPFASNHCYLHKETMQYNDTVVTPDRVELYYNMITKKHNIDSTCKMMSPGSSWSDNEGFEMIKFDYNYKSVVQDDMASKYKVKIDKMYKREDKTLFSYMLFEKYFSNFFRDLPIFISKKGLKFIFSTEDKMGKHFCQVDFWNKKIAKIDKPSSQDIVVEIPVLVLNQCVGKRMWNVLGPSKRLLVDLGENQHENLGLVNYGLGLLNLYDMDYFPLSKELTSRSLLCRLRRWREALEFLRYILFYKIFKRKLVTRLLWPVPKLI